MAWDHLSPDKPHWAYLIFGGFTSLFMLVSLIIKEKFFIGEATVATLCGIIFGPNAANLLDPNSWGNVDRITLELSRIVLVVQCFAVGVELPKFYMFKHWRSVFFLLVPNMTFGWLITSLIMWWLIVPLTFGEALICAACVTATDPVLASSVVGKGKFAKKVPKHLRDLLSAESGCNDGMAFPFIYLAIYLHKYHLAREVVEHWFLYTILWECIAGCVIGVIVGYLARRLLKGAAARGLIDRESLLSFYFVLSLFLAGMGSMLGLDDLLVGFAAGAAFSNDGWFQKETEESHVSNVIDLLLNMGYFVYLGSIIPWADFNNHDLGLDAWRLACIALLVLVFRRIPAVVALRPFIPDMHNFRESFFAGHFGPMGVGAIFVALLARGELEHDDPIPLETLPGVDEKNGRLIRIVWPLTVFLVLASIIVHGSSIAVFALGKHINTLTLTMSYSKSVDDATWMDRLPRIQSRSRSSMSLNNKDDETFEKVAMDGEHMPEGYLRKSPGGLVPPQPAAHRGRTRRRRRGKHHDAGGPISQSAITPQSALNAAMEQKASRLEGDPEKQDLDEISPKDEDDKPENNKLEFYEEGDELIAENEDGDVIAKKKLNPDESQQKRKKSIKAEAEKIEKEALADAEKLKSEAESKGKEATNKSKWAGFDYKGWRKNWHEKMEEEKKKKPGAALAYQFGNTVIVEDEDGEVLKQFEIPSDKPKRPDQGGRKMSLAAMGGWKWGGGAGPSAGAAAAAEGADKTAAEEGADAITALDEDENLRFVVGESGRRMSKAEFLQELSRQTTNRGAKAGPAAAAAAAAAVAPEVPRPEFNRRNTIESRSFTTTSGESGSESDVDSGNESPGGTSQPSQFSLSHTVQAHSGNLGYETAAQRRRRMHEKSLAAPDENEDSEDDGTDRIVPVRRSSANAPGARTGSVGESGGNGKEKDSVGETPAERRRREAALGLATVESDSSETEDEDEDDSNGSGSKNKGLEPPKSTGIRFAEVHSPSQARREANGGESKSTSRFKRRK